MVKVTVNSTGSNRIAITNQNRDTVRTSGVDYTGSSQVAASAFNQANVALSTAQSAFNAANSAVGVAFAFDQANTAYDAANTAFDQASAAFNAANSAVGAAAAFTQANSAYITANTALATAQSAFAQANLSSNISNSYTRTVGTAGNTYTNTVGTAGNNYTNSVGSAGNTYTNTVGTAGNNYTRTVGDAGNTYARTVGTAGNTFTIIAFTQANLALSVAQSAFAKANAGSVGISSDTQILYNDASTVSGSSSLTFNKTTNTLGVTNVSVSGTATLNATSIAINSTELNNKSVLVTTTAESIVDQFANTAARSVYYNISANAATEYHTTQITLIHDDVIAYMTEYGTIWTGNSLATFSVSLVGGSIRLNAISTYANTTYVVFKTVNR